MPHHDPTSIAADGRRRRAKRTSNRPHRTLAARVWAVALAALLPMGTLGPACGAGDEGRDPRDDADDPAFRAGSPTPAEVAAEVALLRAIPLTLSASAPYGTLPGSAGVSPVGEATYTIPIEVTPGVGGMQPELAIAYGANSGQGILGERFGITGGSAIARCPHSIADDGAWAPVGFDDRDGLCLNGERLLRVSGVDGKAGAEYRTQRDPLAKIVLDHDIDTLGGTMTVWSRDGRIMTFGTSAASLWVGNTLGEHIPWQWSIVRQCDRWNNCIDYDYQHGSDFGAGPVELRRTAIRYGGTGPAASQRAVRFNYVVRSDTPLGYSFGVQQRSEALLEDLTIEGPYGALVRRYHFEFDTEPSSERLRLSSISLCDAANVCLPPTVVEWTAPAQTQLEAMTWSPKTWAGESWSDIDAQLTTLLRAKQTILGDYNGDGYEELLVEGDDPASPWSLWSPSSSEVTRLPDLAGILPPRQDVDDGGLSQAQADFQASRIDFNGDGRDDVLVPVRGGWPSVAGGVDSDGHAFAERLLVMLSSVSDEPEMPEFGLPGPQWQLHYIDDGSDDHIYQVVPIDHDGDFYTDAWLCRGPSFNDATWVLAHHVGGMLGVPNDFEFRDSGLWCSAYDEISAASVDGGPASLLVIPALEGPGEWPPVPWEERGGYQRLEFDLEADEAWLSGTGLPRDVYQRTHDRRCLNGPAIAAGYGPVMSAGMGLDKQIDVNGDGLGDIVRLELAVGDGPDQAEILEGVGGWEWGADGAPPTDICDDSDGGLQHDAVVAIYYNTGAGFVRGPNWATLQGNAHANLWVNFVGAQPYDADDDGRVELMMPARGTGMTAWSALYTAADGTPHAGGALPIGSGWPAYSSDDDWREQLAVAARTRILTMGAPERPTLVFVGDIEDSEWFDSPVKVYQPGGMTTSGRPRVARFTDGFGAETAFTYTRLEVEQTPAQWPSARVMSGPVVVSRMTETRDPDVGQGHDGAVETKYAYWGPRVDRLGRGFLGFATVDARRSAGDGATLSTRTEYDQTYDPALRDYPLRGRPIERIEVAGIRVSGGPDVSGGSVPAGSHVVRTTWEWHVEATAFVGGDGYFVYPSTTESRAWGRTPVQVCGQNPGEGDWSWAECDFFAADVSQAYRHETRSEHRDAFGVITLGSVSVEGGASTTVTRTNIVHDEGAWLLGQVGRTEVRDCREGDCATRVSTAVYDPATGEVVQATIQPGDPRLELRSEFARDAHGNVFRVEHNGAAASLGTSQRIEVTEWDAEGAFPLTVTNALSQTSHVIIDAASGAKIATVDPAGLTERYGYDGFYRPVGHTTRATPLGAHDGAPTTLAYLAPELPSAAMAVRRTTVHGQQVTEQIGVTGDVLERRWLGMLPIDAGTPDVILSGEEIVQTYGYDEVGRQVRQSVPHFVSQPSPGDHVRTLDALGRVTSRTAPDGTMLEWTRYEHEGGSSPRTRLITTSMLDGEQLVDTLNLSPDGLVRNHVDAASVSTCFHHGAFGSLTSVVRNCSGANVTSTTTYDVLGHVLAQYDPALGARTSKWNGFGELTETTDGAGRTSEFGYDLLGRLTSRKSTEGIATFTYDTERIGALAASSSPDLVTTEYDVDAFGRVFREATSIATSSGIDTYVMTSTFGPGGRLETLSYPTPDGEPAMTSRMVYDEAGYLRMVKESGSDELRWIVRAGTARGDAAFEEYGNGVFTERSYDPQRSWPVRIHSWENDAEGYDDLQDLSYVWSPEGELSSRTDELTGQAEEFSYDRRLRLKKATISGIGAPLGREFAYDDLGNMTSMGGGSTFEYDALGRLTALDGMSVEHDDAGNVTQIAGRTTTYTSWEKPRQIRKGGATLNMIYDADGDRVLRRDGAGVDTVTLGSLYERKVSASGATQSVTFRIPAGGRMVAEVVRTPLIANAWRKAVRSMHDDHLGSTVLVTGVSAGNVTVAARTAYDPWGRARLANDWKQWQSDSDAAKTSIGFTGHRAELDHGLIDMGGRMYDPRLARFMSADPLVADAYDGASYARYGYVGGRPLLFTDPTGWSAEGGEDEPSMGGGEGGFGDYVLDWANQSLSRASSSLMNTYYTDVAPAVAIGASEFGAAYGELMDSAVKAPVEALVKHGLEELEGIVAGAKWVVDNPTAAVRAMGQGVLDDAKTVLRTYGLVKDALAAGDLRGAASVWLEGAKAAYALAAVFVGPKAVRGVKVAMAARGFSLVALKNVATDLAKTLLKKGEKAAEKAATRAGSAVTLGRFSMTQTVANHATDVVKRGPFKGELARPYLNSPHTVEQILKAGKGVPDPGGAPGALRWDVPGTFRGSQGTWELVMQGDTILHFNFTTP